MFSTKYICVQASQLVVIEIIPTSDDIILTLKQASSLSSRSFRCPTKYILSAFKHVAMEIIPMSDNIAFAFKQALFNQPA